MIGSKHVALLARTLKDIKDFYPEESRYFIARSIAICWFNQITHLSPAKLQSLKDELADKTIIGDFVGKNELTNLVKYS